jgi:hypothetical protein
MASNSGINPAPNPSTDTFNPELWDNTEKTVTTTTIVPDDTVSLLFVDTNTMTAENTFNSTTNFIAGGLSTPVFTYRGSTNQYFSQFITPRTLQAPYPGIIFYANTSQTGIIILPTASESLAGISIIFVRFVNSTRALNSNSSNINNINSLTNINTIMNTVAQSVTLTCGYNGSGYTWYMTMYQ